MPLKNSSVSAADTAPTFAMKSLVARYACLSRVRSLTLSSARMAGQRFNATPLASDAALARRAAERHSELCLTGSCRKD